MQNGYDHTVDWWALGILLFHFLSGVTPFMDENKVKCSIVLCSVVLCLLVFFCVVWCVVVEWSVLCSTLQFCVV